MILLILPSYLKVSTPKSASASIGLDALPLGLTLLYISHICMLSFPLHPPLHFRLFYLSLFPLLSCRRHVIILCFIPGEILGANCRF